MADRDEDDKDDEETSEPPESKARSKRARDDAEDAPRPKKKALAKNTRKGAKGEERKPKPSERAKEREKEREKYRAAEPKSSSSSLIWIGLVAVVALGAWWIVRGQGSSSPKEEPSAARSESPVAETPPVKTPEPPTAKTEEPAAEPEAPVASASAAPEASAAPSPPPSAGGGTFDKGVALDALAKSGAKAAGCRMRGESAGTANVTVTFETSGKVKSAEIRSGTYSGSPTGKCIIRKLLETTIAPFSGDPGQVIAPVSVR